jgi:transcriptional regulator with XRE-family HTH domain
MTFGRYLRRKREGLKRRDKSYSLRQVARRIGVEPAYLSKVERGEVAPPSEEKILRLAGELDEDPDLLLAMAGKVSSDLKRIIRERPQLMAGLLRHFGRANDKSLLAIIDREGNTAHQTPRERREP